MSSDLRRLQLRKGRGKIVNRFGSDRYLGFVGGLVAIRSRASVQAAAAVARVSTDKAIDG